MICRNCGAGLEADRIDTSLGMVTCSHCGGLHDIPRAGIGTDTTPESTSGTPIPRKQRSEVALPSRFKVRKGSGSMEVSWATGGLFPGLVLFLMASATVHMGEEGANWQRQTSSSFTPRNILYESRTKIVTTSTIQTLPEFANTMGFRQIHAKTGV